MGVIVDGKHYDTRFEDQNSYIRRRLTTLYQKERLVFAQTEDGTFFNYDDFIKQISYKGEIPISQEELSKEPYVCASINRQQYSKISNRAMTVQAYLDIRDLHHRYKLADIFALEIKELSRWYNIPLDDFLKMLTKAWKKYNPDADKWQQDLLQYYSSRPPQKKKLVKYD